MERVKFLVEGSQGDQYAVTFELNGTRVGAYCTCPAGSNGQLCKHRMNLMNGDVSRLVSGNIADVVRLKTLLHGTDLEAAYNRVLEAAAGYVKAKKELDAAKKDLSRAMRQ